MRASNANQKRDPDLDEVVFHLARNDFRVFVDLMFHVLHPGHSFVPAPYLEAFGTLLMDVDQGLYRRVIVNMPPRHMKSTLASVLYPAWRLGRDPTTKVLAASYSDDLAHALSSQTRTVMRSALYRALFPKTVLDKTAVDHIKTTAGGYRFATAIGSVVTGFGADLAIIDDPMQPQDAASERVKQKVRSWVSESLLTRFNDPSRGALILVMHRLAPDDLSTTLEPEADCVLRLPLVAETKESIAIGGREVMCREPGDVLNPERFDAKKVDDLRQSLPSFVWASQYQQRPIAGGTGMLSIETFARFDLEKPPKFELKIHSWDVAATMTGNASVGTEWGLAKNDAGEDALFLTRVISLRLELPQVKAAILAENAKAKPSLIVIDERGVGLGLAQSLRHDGLRNMLTSDATSAALDFGSRGTHPSDSKIERFGKATLRIASHTVLIPHAAPWLDRFLYEVAAFPNIRDDDQVDSMTQLVANFERAVRCARIYKDRCGL
jgi:predicted phage terminase large subunit-like protein